MEVKVSVIIVVRNDKEHVLKTIDSLINQTHRSVECIIIDGASKDGTTELVANKLRSIAKITKEYLHYAPSHSLPNNICALPHIYMEAVLNESSGFCFKFLSEKDSGIYDAMNKGIDLASGEWCIFMNSGDTFYNGETIQNLFAKYYDYINGGGVACDVIYGDTHVVISPSRSKRLCCVGTNHKYHHQFVRQSAFIAMPLMRAHRYDTRFRIAGDTDFFTKAHNAGARFKHFDMIVSSLDLERLLDSVSFRMFMEELEIGMKHNKLFWVLHCGRYMFWVVPRYIMRRILPKKIQARLKFGKNT